MEGAWRPIQTYRPGVDPVDVLLGNSGWRRAYEGRWQAPYTDDTGFNWPDTWLTAALGRFLPQPTHWMPLPEPPATR